MSAKKKGKKIAIISALITLISFLYKVSLAYLLMSIIFFIGAISTLMVFICKVLFVRNVDKRRGNKKRAYFIMMLAVFIYSLIFVAFSVFKINGIDISKEIEFDGLLGILFMSLLLVLFILSLIGLKGALEKTDLMVIGLKEITFVSALADLVMIEKFVSLLIIKYKDIENIDIFNNYFAIGTGCFMFLISIFMLIRFMKYKTKTN